jgi:hypothetical protein
MNLFSAKFSLISVISYSLDTWSVTADVVDNMGIFYANDAKVNDIVYSDGTDQNLGVYRYAVSEITLAVGARLTCKLTWADTGTPQAPLLGREAIIGTLKNGVFIMPGRAIQGLTDAFVTYVRNIENITIIQNITTTVMAFSSVVGESLSFNLTTNIASTAFPFITDSTAIYMRGQRLTKGIDFELLNDTDIHMLDQVSAFDAYQIDYAKFQEIGAPIGEAVIGESFIVG